MKIRPQVLSAIMVLGILGVLGVMLGYVEIATGVVAGIVGLGNGLLEKD